MTILQGDHSVTTPDQASKRTERTEVVYPGGVSRARPEPNESAIQNESGRARYEPNETAIQNKARAAPESGLKDKKFSPKDVKKI